MTFDEVLEQALELLEREGRVTYRALKRRFDLDDEYLEDLTGEIIHAKRLAMDENGKVLVWTGERTQKEPEKRGTGEAEQNHTITSAANLQTPDPRRDAAERRQLTVMFCDLVGSTALSTQLDPEELRDVVRAYQEACAAVISRYEGSIAQYLGDGLLVYFGYPTAHEDDAARAVRAGLGILETLPGLNTRFMHPLRVRIGIHTGLVVIGEMGGGRFRDPGAIVGETPNIAARLQEKAEPDTVVISAATSRLVQGLFECQDRGPQTLKGLVTPLALYRVRGASEIQSRFEVAVRTGLTPLVGREQELGLLRERWTKARDGEGQVVLLSGEPGIGKSRLVQVLKEQAEQEGATRIEFRCSPYHQNSAFHPIIDHLQRLLRFTPHDTPQTKVAKLSQRLASYHFPQPDTLPLVAALLSLPHPEGVPPLTLSSQRQKQRTQEALVAWVVEETEQAAVLCAWEDLHWIDPSSLEVLTLVLEQVPTVRLLAVLTFRPEFTPPWRPRAHLTQLTLNRLRRQHVEAMVEEVTGGKALPGEVVHQIVAKTDGVPLFVEELTKMVLEAGVVREEAERDRGIQVPFPLAIPATLQDSLMARLDRLGPAKAIAQVGATLGREFSWAILQAVSPVDEATLEQGLRQLVEAELLYQRGLPPQVAYLFKHALIQDAAYQSLLKSARQQYHRQIAQVLEERVPETVETQPELLAHHYTEGGLIAQAIAYWQQAGQRASQRSANVEAISNLSRGLELLKSLPDTPERAQQELTLQLTLGSAIMATKGFGTPEVEHAYTRARELCRRVGETPQLVPVLWGLTAFYGMKGDFQTATELGEQLMRLAQSTQDPAALILAYRLYGVGSYWRGELAAALDHLEQVLIFYDRQQHHAQAFLTVYDSKVHCLGYAAGTLWFLGYPDQALKRLQEALMLARKLSHPNSLAYALGWAVPLYQLRREVQVVKEQAEALIALCTAQGLPFFLATGTMGLGWALVEQGRTEEGMAQIRQSLATKRAIGIGAEESYLLVVLADACERVRQTEEGLAVVAEALALVDKNGLRAFEAELYRLKGQLTLQKLLVASSQLSVTNPQSLTPNPQAEAEAETCFFKAIEIARKQQAKSLELRAVMSLARLWQQQGKSKEAHDMLSEIYGWFTEGLDTKDLREAKALLEECE